MPARVAGVADREPPLEESVLRVVLLVLGGLRVLVAARGGLPFDGEATIALLVFAGAAWCAARRAWRRARCWWRRSGDLHDGV
jgi:hypothetical protein